MTERAMGFIPVKGARATAVGAGAGRR
jgi:hypothetical protein